MLNYTFSQVPQTKFASVTPSI